MNKDFVYESKKLASDLREIGFENEYKIIIDSIESGATGTEILMALKWNIGKILKKQKNLEKDLKERMKDIIKGIKSLLNM